MPVMMISEVSGQSRQGYDHMLALVGDALRRASGFIMHLSHPVDAGWRVVELWESREDATGFFAAHIAPKLPDGIRPKLLFQPLHSLLEPALCGPAAGQAMPPSGCSGLAPADREATDLVRLSAEANAALMRGDIGRYRDLITLTGDFTLMSPFGGTPTHGKDMTDVRWEALGRFFRNGTLEQELVQSYVSADMVVLVIVEHCRGEVGGLPIQDWPLRVTLVYRREGADWQLAHRHADPLVRGIDVNHAAALARGDVR